MWVSWSCGARLRAGGLCYLLAVSSPLALSGAAFAQAPSAPSRDSRTRIEELMARGIQSREGGHDVEALEFYRQAAALEPENPRVLAHLGVTYHALGRWVSAHTYLVQALQYRDDTYIQRHRVELEEALATVADHIGFLEIYGAPNGAEALLNGQLVAALPMQAPVPVIVGSYLLEVRLEHHYTLGRPITITQRVLTREEVALAPHRTGVPATASDDAPPRVVPRDEAASSHSHWWPWALAGASVAAAATSIVAWERREHYAARWNDDAACLGLGVSRRERCGGDLDRGQRAETVMWVSGAAAGLFAGGALLGFWLSSSDDTRASTALTCVPDVRGAACFGTF